MAGSGQNENKGVLNAPTKSGTSVTLPSGLRDYWRIIGGKNVREEKDTE